MPISTGGITNHHLTSRGSTGSADAIASPARQPVSRTKSDGATLLLGSTESGDTAFSLSGRGTKSPPGTKVSKTSKEKAEEVARKVVSFLFPNSMWLLTEML